ETITASTVTPPWLPRATSARSPNFTTAAFRCQRAYGTHGLPGSGGAAEILRETLAQEEPGAVDPGLHRRQADAEQRPGLRIRDAVNVVEHEGRPVVGRKTVDGRPEPLAGLRLEGGVLEGLGPVPHRLGEVAVGVERGQERLPGHLVLPAPTPELLV